MKSSFLKRPSKYPKSKTSVQTDGFLIHRNPVFKCNSPFFRPDSKVCIECTEIETNYRLNDEFEKRLHNASISTDPRAMDRMLSSIERLIDKMPAKMKVSCLCELAITKYDLAYPLVVVDDVFEHARRTIVQSFDDPYELEALFSILNLAKKKITENKK